MNDYDLAREDETSVARLHFSLFFAIIAGNHLPADNNRNVYNFVHDCDEVLWEALKVNWHFAPVHELIIWLWAQSVGGFFGLGNSITTLSFPLSVQWGFLSRLSDCETRVRAYSSRRRLAAFYDGILATLSRDTQFAFKLQSNALAGCESAYVFGISIWNSINFNGSTLRLFMLSSRRGESILNNTDGMNVYWSECSITQF